MLPEALDDRGLPNRLVIRSFENNFISSGTGIIETAMAWLVPAEKYIDLVDFENLELLLDTQKDIVGPTIVGSCFWACICPHWISRGPHSHSD